MQVDTWSIQSKIALTSFSNWQLICVQGYRWSCKCNPLQRGLIFKQLLIMLPEVTCFRCTQVDCLSYQPNITVRQTAVSFESTSTSASEWVVCVILFLGLHVLWGGKKRLPRQDVARSYNSAISSLIPFNSSDEMQFLTQFPWTLITLNYSSKSSHESFTSIYKTRCVININRCCWCTIQTCAHGADRDIFKHKPFLMSSISFSITVCWQTLYYPIKWWTAFSTEFSRIEETTGAVRLSFHIHYTAKWCSGYIYGLISAPWAALCMPRSAAEYHDVPPWEAEGWRPKASPLTLVAFKGLVSL